jgi:murein DD-endopeptidase MepM/ murein hydrolase activator NlpD
VTVLTLILALAILVTVAAVSNRAKKNNQDANNGQQSEQNDPSNQGQQNGNQSQNSSGDNSKNPSTPPEEQTPSASNTVPEMALPVVGAVNKGYDSTIQVYSTTMGDYRIHLGLDMSAEQAAPVLAAADGVVSKIWDDSMMGKCVAVSHAGDCYTIYKNLDAALPESITVGAKVSTGDCLGYVGQSAVLELAEEPHLHFEMTVGGLSVDPLEYFSEQAMADLAGASDTTETSVNVE